MAATQKKTGARQSAAKTAPKKKASSSRGGSRTAAKQPKSTPRPVRREAGAFLCLLLAIFAAFGCFHIQAIFIDWFTGLGKGLMGRGFWLLPLALLQASYVLAFHRGRPVRLRVTCALVLPVLLSAILHSIMGEPLPWNLELIPTLWKDGQAMEGGGVLSGLLAQALVQTVSRAGAVVIFVLGAALAILGTVNRSITDVVDWLSNRPEYEYQPKEPREPKERHNHLEAEHQKTARQRTADIDIPVEDGPLVGKQRQTEEAAFQHQEKKGLFNRVARVPSPDRLLTGGKEAEPAPVEEPPVPQKEPEVPAPNTPTVSAAAAAAVASAPQPEPQPQPAPQVQAPQPPVHPMPEIHREPAVPKTREAAEETQQAAQEVAQDIQAGMEQGAAAPYQYPPLSLLKEGGRELGGEALVELNANKQRLSDTIRSFGIDANIVNVTRGPSVTRYELELDQGVRLNKLTNLSDDIALALGATGVRIAPIPNKISMVGIEVPNKLVAPVNIHTVLSSKEFQESPSKVSFAVGKDIGGRCIVGNIAKLPHLLIAGTTGSGKSVCTNSLIISLLYKASPEEVRLIMVDPKMVELGIYNGIPHLLIPVVTDPKKAAGALQWAVTEMMKRYRTFSEVGVRDLASYNEKARATEGMETMPQVVVVIDELADLMLVAAKEVEESICRVAQMGRASGMHLIIATQRPSADVITGLMKANIPSRIAFAVASAMESRIILDTQGAEKLVGRGDMLYAPLGAGKPTRVQGCLISDQEVAAVVDFVKRNSGDAQYDDQVMQEIEQHAAEKEKSGKGVGGANPAADGEEYDELINAAIEVVLETGQASVSMLQRRLKLGYARAARLVDQMEERGVVGPFEGSKARQLLITKEQWQEIQYRQGMAPPAAQPAPLPEQPVQEDTPPFDMEEALDRAEEDSL